MYQVILFDLDGTLTDPKEGITKSVQYALKHFSIEEPDLENLTRFIGPPLKESFKTYYGLDDDQVEEAVVKFRERFSTQGIFENGVYTGVVAMLEALKAKGKVVALATSKPEVFAERILERYALRPYFDEVTGSLMDETRTSKGEVIEEALKRLGVAPEAMHQVVMVGDRKHDVIGAKAHKLSTIGVTFGYAEPGELEEAGADVIVDSVEKLTQLLLG